MLENAAIRQDIDSIVANRSAHPFIALGIRLFERCEPRECLASGLHQRLPKSGRGGRGWRRPENFDPDGGRMQDIPVARDRKSTRLNSSHQIISYAVFCLKKKKKTPS